MRQIVRIWFPHAQNPPKWDACGGLNCHSQSCSERYFSTDCLSIAVKASSNSAFPPTKLLPRSHLNRKAGPVWKNLRSQINELASIVFKSSTWIALLTRQGKTRPQRLLSATPTLVLLVYTVHGPNTSNPTFVKGGGSAIFARSGGRSAIFSPLHVIALARLHGNLVRSLGVFR